MAVKVGKLREASCSLLTTQTLRIIKKIKNKKRKKKKIRVNTKDKEAYLLMICSSETEHKQVAKPKRMCLIKDSVSILMTLKNEN